MLVFGFATPATAAEPPRDPDALDRRAEASPAPRADFDTRYLGGDEMPESPVIANVDGFLTGPGDGDPAGIALGYLRLMRATYGLDEDDIASLRLVDRYTTPDGITHLRWQQRFGGVAMYEYDLRANVTEDGRLINLIGLPAADVAVPSLEPRIGARSALAGALDSVGAVGPAPAVKDVAGRSLATDFRGLDSAELTLFGDADEARLAWWVLADAGSEAFYNLVVDASSGEVLRRTNLVQDANNASVFDYFPGAPNGGTARTVDLAPWISNANTSDDLAGPNAIAWGDFNSDNAYQDGGVPNCFENICPTNASPPFQYARNYLNIQYAGGNCPAIGCGWDFNRPATSSTMNDGSWFWTTLDRTGAQAFYLVNNFHDYLRDDPQIAFNQQSGNFEGNDPILTQVVDGANGPGGLPDPQQNANNANMATLPDGQPGIMQMYLFGPTQSIPEARAVSGADDAGIVYHEYVHGLTNRLIVDAQGGGGLASEGQPGALGEAYGDWYAYDYLVAQGFQGDSGADGEVKLSVFEVLNPPSPFRTESLDCSVGGPCPGTATAGPGGYTFGDYGRIEGAPQVHDDGEIWSQTLWDLRKAVGSDTAQGLVTGGMRMTPPFPTFLNARDAILQQALATGGESLQSQVWRVFATRGMGVNAFTAGPADVNPIEDFSVPAPPAAGTCNGRPANFFGTAANERIKGTNGADVINGAAGNDRINGNSGKDTLCGGGGRDRLAGGGGNDRLLGGGGKDTCLGGGGKDRGAGCEKING